MDCEVATPGGRFYKYIERGTFSRNTTGTGQERRQPNSCESSKSRRHSFLIDKLTAMYPKNDCKCNRCLSPPYRTCSASNDEPVT